MKTRTPHDWTWDTWRTRLGRLLQRTESRYELDRNEILLATGTDTENLRELWNYGWTPGEAAQAITEALGLR
jgi:enoyl reductase-like protein